MGLIPGLGRYLEGGHGNPLQYSYLENPMDRGTQGPIVHRVTQSQTRLKRLSSSSSTIWEALEGSYLNIIRAPQVVLVVKNMPDSAGDIRDTCVILGWEDSLEEGMATHSSIPTWRIPWTEESGRLQSIGSQRVGDN